MPLRARQSLLLIAFAHAALEFCNNFMPVLYPILMPAMGLNFTQVGVVALVSTTCMALAQPLFGWLSDRGRPELLTALSLVGIGLFMGMVGFAPTYPLLLVLIALGGLCSAAFHPPAAVITVDNSGKRRGAGLSIFSVGGNVGMALSPLWMSLALVWLGLAGTITLIPVGIAAGVAVYVVLRHERRAGATQASSRQSAAEGFFAGLIIIVVAMMFRSWFQVAVTTYLPIWVEANGGTAAAGATILAAFMFAASLGSLVGGPIGDRYGHWQVIVACTVIMPISYWLFLSGAGWLQWIMIVVAGVAVGATYPTSLVMALESWPRHMGIASGLLMGLGWWPGGIGASVTGYVADHRSLATGMFLLVFAPLISLLCMFVYAAFARARHWVPAAATE